MNSTFKIEGFIDIEIINKKDNTKRVYSQHNTLTKGGAQLFLARSAGSLLKSAGDSFGQIYCIDSWDGRDGNVRTSRIYNTITNVLLNMDTDKLSSMTSSSTFMDFYNDDFNDLSRVKGYANLNTLHPNDGLEGTVDYSKGEYVADGYVRAMRWYYDRGVASGTFNCIAMMSRSTAQVAYPVNYGTLFGKIIDRVNRSYSTWSSNSTRFCPPGVPGVTDNDTILMNFTQDYISRWKYTISTGEVAEVPSSDPFWLPLHKDQTSSSVRLMDYFIEGDYLYTLEVSGVNLPDSPASSNNADCRVYAYQISTRSDTPVTSFRKSLSNVYLTCCHFLRYNGNVYVTYNSDEYYTSSTLTSRGYKLTKTGDYYDGSTTISDMIVELGITKPAGIDYRKLSFGNYGNNYIVSIGRLLIETSDLDNIHANMVQVIPNLYMGSTSIMVPFSAGSNKGFLSIGCPYGYAFSSSNQSALFTTDMTWFTYPSYPTQPSNPYISDFSQTGLFITMDGWWTSLLSYAVLNTPITKADDEEMYVSYGYRVMV